MDELNYFSSSTVLLACFKSISSQLLFHVGPCSICCKCLYFTLLGILKEPEVQEKCTSLLHVKWCSSPNRPQQWFIISSYFCRCPWQVSSRILSSVSLLLLTVNCWCWGLCSILRGLCNEWHGGWIHGYGQFTTRSWGENAFLGWQSTEFHS